MSGHGVGMTCQHKAPRRGAKTSCQDEVPAEVRCEAQLLEAKVLALAAEVRCQPLNTSHPTKLSSWQR